MTTVIAAEYPTRPIRMIVPFAPGGTPKEIIALLQREIAQILTLPDVKENFARQGAEINSAGPEQFAAYIKADLAKWAKVAKDSNIRIE